jgi:hypothetical protein
VVPLADTVRPEAEERDVLVGAIDASHVIDVGHEGDEGGNVRVAA